MIIGDWFDGLIYIVGLGTPVVESFDLTRLQARGAVLRLLCSVEATAKLLCSADVCALREALGSRNGPSVERYDVALNKWTLPL